MVLGVNGVHALLHVVLVVEVAQGTVVSVNVRHRLRTVTLKNVLILSKVCNDTRHKKGYYNVQQVQLYALCSWNDFRFSCALLTAANHKYVVCGTECTCMHNTAAILL